ncbi:hypothetical protein HBI56_057250 [Parastagonospora nodorum]|nr:hypothetical protein HBH53_150230 [Parastagonospora nodorum]KAH3966967.1 hypothetical protein HBH51_141640 [Parastagonospora nodorum]KAH4002913.1 hypothetical protein HBI10_070230 [Parastagonospora nodorum]KAH4027925.1 hypothetical protein HBI13_047790 [Parastagonospora nodorum]KAH4091851.1 hypothetical protein HBH46_183510 [Parastagonospora nodorum]
MRGHSSQSALNAQLNFLLQLTKDRHITLQKLKDVDGDAPTYLRSVEGRRLEGYADSLEKSIVSVSDSYARVWNLGFASNIVQRLPQELKDMIYRELMHHGPPDFDREERRRQDKPSSRWVYSGSSPEHNELRGCTDYPHYFQSDYVGTDFVTELSKQFHKEKHFILQHPGELEGFLSDDRFWTACVPADFVRFISIDLSLKLFNVRTGNCREWSSPKFDEPLKQHFVAALRGTELLKALVKRNNAGAQRTLLLRVDCTTPNHGAKFAEVLVPLVYDLKDQGWNIKVEGEYNQPLILRGQACTTDRDAQLTAYDFDYSLSRAEWAQKIRNSSAFIIQFVLRNAHVGIEDEDALMHTKSILPLP